MNEIRYFAVIPAYEPDERLITLAAEAEGSGFFLIIVDDGSGPAYSGIFAQAAVYGQVISYPDNGGKGHAMKKAFEAIASSGEAGIVTILDCDGQHTVADALRLCAAAEGEPGALWLGSRRQSSASPLRSRFGNAVTRTVFRLVSGAKIYDTQTGMRAFSTELLPRMLEIPGERYEYEMNMLLQLAEAGTPMKELPIETIYIDNNSGSHFHTIRDSWRVYKELLKFSGSSLLAFCVDYLMYSLLTLVTGSALYANIEARIISSAVNYTVNRRLVFRDDGPAVRSAVRYFGLAAAILAANTGLLWLLTQVVGIGALPAKLMTELSLFAVSYLVQKRAVFSKARGQNERKKAPMKGFLKRKAYALSAGVLITAFTAYALLDTFVIPHSYATVAETEAASQAAMASGEESQAAVVGGEDEPKSFTTKSLNRVQSGVPGSTSSHSRKKKPSSEGSTEGQSSQGQSGNSLGQSSLGQSASAQAQDDASQVQDDTSQAQLGSAQSAAPAVTDTSYTADGVSVTLSEYRVQDTTVYVADVVLDDASSIKTALADDTYGRNIKDSTSAIAAAHDAILAVNGDFYGARNAGYVIRNGVLYRSTSSGSEDLVIYADGSFEIISEDEISAEALLAKGAMQVLSFGPGLIEDGQIAITADEEVGKAMASNPRTALGVTADGHYLFVVSDGRTDESEGLSLYELAQFLQTLGAQTAYNLDGGGSSTMVFNGTVINNPTTGGSTIKERSVSDIVYIGA